MKGSKEGRKEGKKEGRKEGKKTVFTSHFVICGLISVSYIANQIVLMPF
jgi:hypothetical protein